jgi:hypothetical protein
LFSKRRDMVKATLNIITITIKLNHSSKQHFKNIHEKLIIVNSNSDTKKMALGYAYR